MDNIIKELKLQLGEKKEVVLTVDEAKKLKEALDELFGKEVVKEVSIPYPYPVWQWWYPLYPAWSISTTTNGLYRITTNGCTAFYDDKTSAMTLKVA